MAKYRIIKRTHPFQGYTRPFWYFVDGEIIKYINGKRI